MYEDKTFENILNSMLSRIPDDIDKREGSIIYNALAPAAYELAQAYFYMGNLFKLAFVETSYGEYLTKLCSQYGVTRKPAIAAIRKGIFKNGSNMPFDVPIGSRFGIEGIIFKAIQKISDGEFKMICETTGSIGNIPTGVLLPIDNIPGLGYAQILDVILPGEDEESDELLRQRTLMKVKFPSTSGNANHYRIWALEVPGVGDARVFPLWNGPGTVKVVVVDSNKQPANNQIVSEVVQHIEENRPIGVNVTVVSAAQKIINISATIMIAQGYFLQDVTANFILKVKSYLKDIALKTSYVSYAKIGTVLLETEGVIDYSGLLINGSTSNISLAEDEVATLGNVDLGV